MGKRKIKDHKLVTFTLSNHLLHFAQKLRFALSMVAPRYSDLWTLTQGVTTHRFLECTCWLILSTSVWNEKCCCQPNLSFVSVIFPLRGERALGPGDRVEFPMPRLHALPFIVLGLTTVLCPSVPYSFIPGRHIHIYADSDTSFNYHAYKTMICYLVVPNPKGLLLLLYAHSFVPMRCPQLVFPSLPQGILRHNDDLIPFDRTEYVYGRMMLSCSLPQISPNKPIQKILDIFQIPNCLHIGPFTWGKKEQILAILFCHIHWSYFPQCPLKWADFYQILPDIQAGWSLLAKSCMAHLQRIFYGYVRFCQHSLSSI